MYSLRFILFSLLYKGYFPIFYSYCTKSFLIEERFFLFIKLKQ